MFSTLLHHTERAILRSLSMACVLVFVSACGGGGGSSRDAVLDDPVGSQPPSSSDVPSVPAGLAASAQSDSEITVSWNASASADSYSLYWSTSANDPSADSVQVNALSYSLTGIEASTRYYISVLAENENGASTKSAEVSVMTAAAPGGGNAGTPWSAQTLINRPYSSFGNDNYLGGVDINGAGVAAATWIFDGGEDTSTFVMVNHNSGGAWSEETMLVDAGGGQADTAVTPQGVVHVVWTEHMLDANGFRQGATVKARRLVNGAWTPSEDLSSITPGSSDYAHGIATEADGHGNVHVVWIQNNASLWSNRFLQPDASEVANGASAGWQTPTLISDSIRNLYPPALGTNAREQAVLVWLQDTQPNDSTETAGGPSLPVTYSSHYADGSWSSATAIGHQDLSGFDGAERIRIAVNAAGDATTIWQQTRNAGGGASPLFNIDALHYRALTGTWGQPETIASADWYLSWPSVGIDGQRHAVASWQPTDAADSSQRVLQTADYRADNDLWGDTVTLLRTAEGEPEPYAALVAMTATGSAHAVWGISGGGLYWSMRTDQSAPWSASQEIGNRTSSDIRFKMHRSGHAIVVTNPLIVANNRFEHAVYANTLQP